MPKAKESRSKRGSGVKLVTSRGRRVAVATGRHVYLLPVLDAKLDKPENKMTPFEKMELVEEGISKKALQSLKDKADLDYNQLSTILNVARATLINKKGNEKFNKDVSDKILGLADIYAYGYQVFNDRDRFNQWIFRPNAALGQQRLLTCCTTALEGKK